MAQYAILSCIALDFKFLKGVDGVLQLLVSKETLKTKACVKKEREKKNGPMVLVLIRIKVFPDNLPSH